MMLLLLLDSQHHREIVIFARLPAGALRLEVPRSAEWTCPVWRTQRGVVPVHVQAELLAPIMRASGLRVEVPAGPLEIDLSVVTAERLRMGVEVDAEHASVVARAEAVRAAPEPNHELVFTVETTQRLRLDVEGRA